VGEELVDEGGVDEAVSSSDEEEGDEEAFDWEQAGTMTIRPIPVRVPEDLRAGDKIVVYFPKPYSKWFVGVVKKVDMRCKQLPVFANFDDGESRLSLDPEMYGVTGGKQWALLAEPDHESAVDLDSEDDNGGETAGEAGPSNSRAVVANPSKRRRE